MNSVGLWLDTVFVSHLFFNYVHRFWVMECIFVWLSVFLFVLVTNINQFLRVGDWKFIWGHYGATDGYGPDVTPFYADNDLRATAGLGPYLGTSPLVRFIGVTNMTLSMFLSIECCHISELNHLIMNAIYSTKNIIVNYFHVNRQGIQNVIIMETFLGVN